MLVEFPSARYHFREHALRRLIEPLMHRIERGGPGRGCRRRRLRGSGQGPQPGTGECEQTGDQEAAS
jgi:hypothetical protein